VRIAEYSLDNRVVTIVLAFALLLGGLKAFQGMSRLEDPEFTIKDALVITPYPGASATEVEEEVTDNIELAVQQLAQLDEIESKSDRGLSTLTVSIKDRYDKDTLPQVWDELRRKVGDAQRGLPPGAGPSIIVDDFGMSSASSSPSTVMSTVTLNSKTWLTCSEKSFCWSTMWRK